MYILFVSIIIKPCISARVTLHTFYDYLLTVKGGKDSFYRFLLVIFKAISSFCFIQIVFI